MSISPGDLKLKDPDSARNAQFDWRLFLGTTAQIASAEVVVDGPDANLIVDNIVSSGQLVDYKVRGGTLGKRYSIRCRIRTDEASEQTEDKTIRVKIVNA